MRTPYDAYFRIDDSGKGPPEERVKPDSTVHIQVNREIKVTHLEHELIVGFDGDSESKPRIVSVENRFVKLGRIRACSPDTTDEHYIDVKDNYHIKRDQQLVRDNTYSSGFFVEIGAPGRYPMNIRSIHDTGEGKSKQQLVLIVESA